jgi:hypothetical protein
MTLVLLLHAASTLWMTGLIWFVQVVHYPLFALVGPSGFATYEHAHTTRTTLVVGPPMLLELATTVALLGLASDAVPRSAAWTGAALLAVIWLSTALLQVPQHSLLSFGFDARASEFLVQSNWVRTIGWSLRAVLALWLLWRLLPAL